MDYARRMNVKQILRLCFIGQIFCICQLVNCEDKSVPKGVKRSFDFPTIFYPGPDNKFITSAPLPRLPKNLKALIKNAGTSPTKSTPPGFHVKMSEKGEIDDIFSDIPPSSPNPNTHPSPSSPLRSSEHNSQKLLPSNELIQHPQEHLQTVSKHRHNSQAKFPLNNIPHFLNPIPSLVTVAFKRIPTTRAPVQHDINSKYSGEDGSDHDKGSHEYDYNEEDNVESEDDKENHSKQHQNVRHQSQSEQLHDVHQNTRPKSTLHAVSLSRDLADYHSNDQRDHISNHKDHGQLKYIHLEKPISFTVPLPFHGEQHSSPQLQTKLASSPSQPILRVNPNQMSSTERPEKIPPRQPPYWHQRAPFSRLSTSMDRRPPPFTNHENHEGSISSLSAQPSHRVLGHLSDLKKSQNNELHGGQQEKPGKSTSHQLYDGQPHLMSSIPPKGPLTSFDTNSNVKSSNTEEKDKKSVGHARQTTFSCQDKSGYYADVEAGCEMFHICHQNRKFSFMCPTGTLFHQKFLICDWAYKVKCPS